jgi:Family of unknown function (DUF6077)
LTHRIRLLDAWVVLASVGALILVWPLRDAFEATPLVPFMGALILFMAPGVLLSHWFLNEHFPGAASVPVSFAISTGIFGLSGIPMLILHRSLEVYLFAAGAIVAAFVAAAGFRTLRRRPPSESKSSTSAVSWLWVPFLLLSAVLAFVSRARPPGFYNDRWVYLAYVREFLNTDNLALYEPYFGDKTAALSRVKVNGWLLEQAALSRLSGIDPVELVLRYLDPTLIVVALLAFYALARILLESETGALLAGSVYALFFLLSLEPLGSDFGGAELIGRITEDKLTARFVFLPVALGIAVVFLRNEKLRYLAAFAFLCWAAVVVHPVGLAITGLSMAGFELLYLAFNLRKREAWMKTGGLGLAGLSVLLVPAFFVLVTGDSFTALLKGADINSGDPDVLANMVFVQPERERIYELGEDSYIMHPSLVLEPVILVAYVLGIPFLLWRLRRSLAAQLLLGMMLVTTIVCYVPPVATFVGNHVVVPGQLWRLAWPIPLAALLTIGWMAWEATRRAQLGLNRVGIPGRASQLLSLALVGVLMAVAAPAALAGVKKVYREDQVARSGGSCFDPTLRWMRDNIAEPSVVLTHNALSSCIPAYSAHANVVSSRGALVLEVLPALERRAPGQIEVPQGALDVRKFFNGPTFEEAVRILRRYEVDYVMLSADSPLDKQLRQLSGFVAIDTPGERYNLYAVNYQKLGG